MTEIAEDHRVFLFLQGPHGPFFNQLGKMLRLAGAEVWRVGFNAGDRAFWFHPQTYIPYRGTTADWPETFQSLIEEKGVTDIVLYGDTRPIHAQALEEAKARGITVHVFEEGYMRPYWVSYERGGSNGNSRLMDMTIPQMQAALEQSDIEAPLPPGHWGDMRQHIFYGALYHWFVMFRNGDYSNFRPHRSLPVTKEFRLYFKRLLLMPFLSADRLIATL
ncbi:MAG: capsule biosynthesis protein CapA, partial [Sulfitobacter sp.]|nr:capsule biosynthesis protein CapA [Sulfitobacter sp.]